MRADGRRRDTGLTHDDALAEVAEGAQCKQQTGSDFGWAQDEADVALNALTFDMRGGRKQAKLAFGRPLDGRVRALVGEGRPCAFHRVALH
jgi:hypothetical protein